MQEKKSVQYGRRAQYKVLTQCWTGTQCLKRAVQHMHSPDRRMTRAETWRQGGARLDAHVREPRQLRDAGHDFAGADAGAERERPRLHLRRITNKQTWPPP